ncbi:helix-turn-helix domain-containing protein [Asinibacterium sp. OR53]|uniref:helix-turn-helix domain-containing protein n=1 Tax=Asinibacterium sp. OR53 TaxID=925409 RepID=UPI00047DF24E|nr:helix-turn-helix transcriptional regulator [Asinibacterium sp. OR53]
MTDKQVEKTKIDLYVIRKVKERRLKVGMSQADLAYALDVSVGFIGKIESPNYPTHYNIKHLNDLAKILKCSLQDFLPKKPL